MAKKSPAPPGRSADLPADEFRAAMRRTADMVAGYLERVGDFPVLPKIAPGEVSASIPVEPPEEPEPLDRILDDYERLIEPRVTHWNHPGFFGYFAITGSGPGILGETLSAALNVNAMLWRTGPAPTELEERVCDWLRRMIGLPDAFRGHINDTASSGSLLALAAARHRADPEGLRAGLAGRAGLPPLTLYASDQAHVSIDKAAIALGIGLDNLRRVASDDRFRLDPAALAAALAADRREGRKPIAVVATVGTTATTSVDPVGAIAAICRREKIWLHVDAAYAGSAAICPEHREKMAGLEAADSIILNPHKWLFTPVDCSVLLLRDPEALRAAFSVVPEYLRAPETGVTNLMEYGFQLGRRFRALKLWMVIRAFGVEGLRRRIRDHCEMARRLADRIGAEPGWELCAPAPFSLVCFRCLRGDTGEDRNRFNERLLGEVNAAGPVLLSHAMLRGRFVLRLAIGNLRTTPRHVDEAWELIRRTADRL